MDSMDSIDLLHKIAKTPNILGGVTPAWEAGPPQPPMAASNGGLTLTVPPERPAGPAGPAAPPPPPQARHKLVKQKSLNRTLSTSVLRIKKKRSFWSSA